MREPGIPSYASGPDAWDGNGDHFRLAIGDLGLDGAARVLKHGAELGMIERWGDETRWVEVPSFTGSSRLKALTRWLDELRSPPARYFTLWKSPVDSRTLVIVAEYE
jgi:hypothetical protein